MGNTHFAGPDIDLTLRVNGCARRLHLDSRTTLLDALREYLGLTGTNMGCDQGACGACTILLDQKRVLACLVLAAQCDSRDVTTIEGLARDGQLHPVQEAFIRHDGFQCGYCTPGQIMSAVALLEEGRAGSDAAAAAFAPAPVNRLAAVIGVLVLVAGIAGAILHTGLCFVPALVVLAIGGVKLWREQS